MESNNSQVCHREPHIAWALKQPGLGVVSRLVLIAIAERANAALTCFPSICRLAADVEISTRAVANALPDLVARGLIDIVRDPEERTAILRRAGARARAQSNVYRLLRPADDAPSRPHRHHDEAAPVTEPAFAFAAYGMSVHYEIPTASAAAWPHMPFPCPPSGGPSPTETSGVSATDDLPAAESDGQAAQEAVCAVEPMHDVHTNPYTEPSRKKGRTALRSVTRASAPDDGWHNVIFVKYNEMAARSGLAPLDAISRDQWPKLRARINEHGVDDFLAGIEAIGASSFCCGANDTGWQADFDFLIGAKGCRRAISGRYADRDPAPRASKLTGAMALLHKLHQNRQERGEPNPMGAVGHG